MTGRPDGRKRGYARLALALLRMLTMLETNPLLVVTLFGTILSGCATLAQVPAELPLASSDLSLKVTDPAQTKLLLFNASDVRMYKLDGSGRINVFLSEKGVAQLDIGQYAQLIVAKGKYTVRLTHVDLVEFTSEHTFDLTEDESILEFCATPLGHKARLRGELPTDFLVSFKPIEDGFPPSLSELWDKPYFQYDPQYDWAPCSW